MKLRLFSTILVAFGFVAGLSSAVNAESPAALVLDITGGSTPEVEPFGEVFAGESITMDTDVEIEFLHYATCSNVLVQGGRITFTQRQYLVKGGEIIEAKRGKCPKSYKMAAAGQTGGVVLRASGKPKLSTQPEFILVGANRDNMDKISILHDGNVVMQSAINSAKIAWPDNAAPLQAGERYTIQLWSKAGGEPHTLALTAVDRRGQQPPTLLRID